ncbi:MAG: Rne/Rng family ribonuclease [Candidatus Acidiferrales bacterium]
MSKEMVISATPHETRVAIMEDGQLCEIYVEREKEFALVGSIYKGRVTRVLPGMQSAFVEIGLDSDAFLYVSDFLEGLEEYDQVVQTVEQKTQKMEEQGGHVFAPESSQPAVLEPPEVIGTPENPAPALIAPAAAAAPGVAPGEHPAEAPRSMAPSAPYQGRRDSGGPRGGFGGDRNRHGRHGRRGGGGGRGDRHRGRELPPSKYASHRPYEPPSSPAESGAAGEVYEPIILPGESLAKYRERTPSPVGSSSEISAPQEGELNATAAAPALESTAPPASPEIDVRQDAEKRLPAAELTAEPAHAEHAEIAQPVAEPPRFEPLRVEHPHETYAPRWQSSGGIEPLPGESIAKFRNKETPRVELEAPSVEPPAAVPGEPTGAEISVTESGVTEARFSPIPTEYPEPGVVTSRHRTQAYPAPVEESSAPAFPEPAEPEHEIPEASDAVHSAIQEPAFEPPPGERVATHFVDPELTAEEANSLAEQVAEAQKEEEEREAEASADADADADAEDEAEADTEAEDHEGVNGAEVEESGELIEAATEEIGGMGELDHPGLELAEQMGAEAAEIEASGIEGAADAKGTSVPLAGNPTQTTNARVQSNSRARMQHPMRRGGRRREGGNRPRPGGHGGHGHRPAPRRPQLISELLKQGQEIIVQIAKEPLGKKGARITSHVALPGRYLVYMPTLDHTGVSRKIGSAEDRSRLRHLVTEAKGTSGGGFIVRTAAAGATPDEIRTDVQFLTRLWNDIRTRSEQRKAPTLLHRDLNLVERILRDYLSSDYTAIWVDNEEEYAKVVDFVSRFQPALAGRVKLYTRESPIFEEFGIQQEIDKGLRPKVWLKSGGSIVINHTEALVAIDVNTGKFVGRGSTRLEDTIVRTNLEAVKEVVRQIRLRDLGGIIIIDFIDMEERRNREKVMAALEEALRADRAPSKVLRFNEFGLVAITRKRTKQALERTLCQPCPYCTGSGMVKSVPTLCYEIQVEARKMATEIEAGSITLRVHPEIAKALKTREAGLIEEFERWTKKSVIIQADPTLHWEQYDIY